MARSAKPSGQNRRSNLRGRRPQQKLRRTFLIFCEGRITERRYLEALRKTPEVRNSVSIRIGRKYGMPLQLVKAAIKETSSHIDDVWCVFDVEAPTPHPDLLEAVALAKKNNVSVAISNPCFELWLLLHFEDHQKPATATQLTKHFPTKNIDGSFYVPHRHEAAQRARALHEIHESRGKTLPDNNPSSAMYRLMKAVDLATTD